jgi:hypothetical protein
MPCSPLKINGRFGGTCCLHLQGRRISQARKQSATRFMLVSCLAYTSILTMDVTWSPETSVDFQWTTRRYIPGDTTLWILYTFIMSPGTETRHVIKQILNHFLSAGWTLGFRGMSALHAAFIVSSFVHASLSLRLNYIRVLYIRGGHICPSVCDIPDPISAQPFDGLFKIRRRKLPSGNSNFLPY